MIRATGVRRGWSLPSGGRGSSTTASGSESRVPTNAIRVPSGDQSGLAAPSGMELGWPGRRAGGLDRLGLEQLPDDDPAAILSRLGVSPCELVCDAFAVATQPDMIDPAKSIEVFSCDRSRHGAARCYQQATCFR